MRTETHPNLQRLLEVLAKTPSRVRDATLLWHSPVDAKLLNDSFEEVAKGTLQALSQGKHLKEPKFLIALKDQSITELRTQHVSRHKYLATAHPVSGMTPGRAIQGRTKPNMAIIAEDRGNRMYQRTPKTMEPQEAIQRLISHLQRSQSSKSGSQGLQSVGHRKPDMPEIAYRNENAETALARAGLSETGPVSFQAGNTHFEATALHLDGDHWLVEIRQLQPDIRSKLLQPAPEPHAVYIADANKLQANAAKGN